MKTGAVRVVTAPIYGEKMMFYGKKKAITFSYDDAVTQDIRLLEILNRYELKATFNINSERLGRRGTLTVEGVTVDNIKHQPSEIKHIYKGHEVAAHTLTHPKLTDIRDEAEIIRQVEQDRLNLSELVGYEVKGMAYPCGPPNSDDRVANIIKNDTGIRYARAFDVTGSFEPYEDLYQYKGTMSHWNNWDSFFEIGEKFLKLKAETPKVLYIWGHSFELDAGPKRWERFEEFCRMIAGQDDIFYGTNMEVFEALGQKEVRERE